MNLLNQVGLIDFGRINEASIGVSVKDIINEKIVATLPKKKVVLRQPFKKKVRIKPFC
jgi:hypothetical protein